MTELVVRFTEDERHFLKVKVAIQKSNSSTELELDAALALSAKVNYRLRVAAQRSSFGDNSQHEDDTITFEQGEFNF